MSYFDTYKMEHVYSFLWGILYLRQTNILCYKVFECNDIIEKLQLHIFFKKSGGWVRNVFEGTIQSAAWIWK